MPLLKEPAITLEGVRVQNLSVNELNLEITLLVANPNLFGVTIRDLPFSLLCKVGSGQQKIATGNAGSVKIRGNGSIVLTIPVTVDNAGIICAIAGFIAHGGMEVTVSGTASVDCLVTCRPIPFSKAIMLTTRHLTDALSPKPARKKNEQ